MVKNLPAIQETRGQSLGLEDPLEKGMTTHSSIFAWRIPWTEEPGIYSPQDHKESDMTKVTQQASKDITKHELEEPKPRTLKTPNAGEDVQQH